ncbi:hypothetical protein [Psychrobacter pacificensis]|uniref:hypothetical protein n=1 Tax=Psychrobacter pacificensis TaxID=112002 RepID=UPI001CBAEC97|nr:hypothetical protein [Psychrobacter pacificensis]MBZ1392299.1 hypothetical protein [Psychrobacter pacificensis]
MASVLSRLSILLHADTAQFRRDIRDTQTRIGRFAGGAKQAMKAAGVGVAAGASIAATAIGGIAKEQIKAATEFERFAQVSNTNAVVFQRNAAAAEKMGIEADKLAGIYQDMNDRVGDFVQTGGGPMADFFENIGPKVGVTAEQFKNLSGPDALQLFYSSLERANLSQADMTFYMESMSGDLTALQPLLKNGGQGFKELGDQAQNAGSIMSQSTIDSTKKLNGQLTQLKEDFKGIKVQIYEAVLPALLEATEWFKNNKTEIKSFIDGTVSVVKTMTPIVVGAFKAVHKTAVFMGEGVAQLVITFTNTKNAVVQKINDIKNGFINAKNSIVNTATSIKNAFVNLPSAMAQIGRDIIQGLINGIKAKASAAVNLIKNTASDMYQGVKNFFVVRSPSRLMRALGKYIIEGLVVGIKDKKSDAYKAALDVAKSLVSGMETIKRDIALFGNDSAVSAFDYDVLMGKYDNVAPKLREQYRADLLKLESMKREEQNRAKVMAAIKDRAAQFQSDQSSAANDFNNLDINGPQTEAEKLRQAYQNKMAIIDRFEQMHTDKAAQAEAARTRLREKHNQDMSALDQARLGSTLASTTSMFKDLLGESNSGYKALFAVQKMYDFAQAESASLTAIAKAWSSAPFPANLPAVGMTTLKTGIIPAAIQAIKPSGFKDGGYTGNYPTNMPVGPAHGREFVAHAVATRKYRPELEAMNDGTYERQSNAPNVNVNVTVSMDGNSNVASNSAYGKQIGQGLAAVVVSEVNKMTRPNGTLDRLYAKR